MPAAGTLAELRGERRPAAADELELVDEHGLHLSPGHLGAVAVHGNLQRHVALVDREAHADDVRALAHHDRSSATRKERLLERRPGSPRGHGRLVHTVRDVRTRRFEHLAACLPPPWRRPQWSSLIQVDARHPRRPPEGGGPSLARGFVSVDGAVFAGWHGGPGWCMIGLRPVGGPDVPSLPRLANRAPCRDAGGRRAGARRPSSPSSCFRSLPMGVVRLPEEV
jgi:hypothetical protein